MKKGAFVFATVPFSTTLDPTSNTPLPPGPIEIIPNREVARYRADATARGEHVQEWPMSGTGARMTCVRRFATADELDDSKSYRHLGLPILSDP